MNQPEPKYYDLDGCAIGWHGGHLPRAASGPVIDELEGFRSRATPISKETFDDLVAANERDAT